MASRRDRERESLDRGHRRPHRDRRREQHDEWHREREHPMPRARREADPRRAHALGNGNQRHRHQRPEPDRELERRVPAGRMGAPGDPPIEDQAPDGQPGEDRADDRQHAGDFMAQAERERSRPDDLVSQSGGARNEEERENEQRSEARQGRRLAAAVLVFASAAAGTRVVATDPGHRPLDRTPRPAAARVGAPRRGLVTFRSDPQPIVSAHELFLTPVRPSLPDHRVAPAIPPFAGTFRRPGRRGQPVAPDLESGRHVDGWRTR